MNEKEKPSQPESETSDPVGLSGAILPVFDCLTPWQGSPRWTGCTTEESGVQLPPTGGVRLGGRDAVPEYSTFSWIARLFSAGLAIGLFLFVILVGPTGAIFRSFFRGLGTYIVTIVWFSNWVAARCESSCSVCLSCRLQLTVWETVD